MIPHLESLIALEDGMKLLLPNGYKEIAVTTLYKQSNNVRRSGALERGWMFTS